MNAVHSREVCTPTQHLHLYDAKWTLCFLCHRPASRCVLCHGGTTYCAVHLSHQLIAGFPVTGQSTAVSSLESPGVYMVRWLIPKSKPPLLVIVEPRCLKTSTLACPPSFTMSPCRSSCWAGTLSSWHSDDIQTQQFEHSKLEHGSTGQFSFTRQFPRRQHKATYRASAMKTC